MDVSKCNESYKAKNGGSKRYLLLTAAHGRSLNHWLLRMVAHYCYPDCAALFKIATIF
jgi:hypothetical protein